MSERAESGGDGWDEPADHAADAEPEADTSVARDADGAVQAGSPVTPDRDLFGRTPKNAPDWSHRRGEPRLFALLWTVYLMAAVIWTFIHLGPVGVFSAEAYRPAARRLVIAIAVGVVLLWPLVRLSQRAPSRRPGGAVAADLVVLLFPALALVWPQVVLAGWSLEVVLAATAVLVAAAIATGGVIYFGFVVNQPAARMAAMVGLLLWVLAVPAWAMGTAASQGLGPEHGVTLEPARGWMFSPLTAIAEVLRDRSWTGTAVAVSAAHWRTIGWLWMGALVVCAAAVAARLALAGRRA